jgi:glucan phosphoethanolaminetransferase (alkaline phosphatase superfamily)
MPPKPSKFLIISFLALAACRGKETGTSSSSSTAPHPPRRVFFITVDTLRADHMSLYGYPRATTPDLQKLAAMGVTFDHAVTQWPRRGARSRRCSPGSIRRPPPTLP